MKSEFFQRQREREDTSMCDTLNHRRTRARKRNPDLATHSVPGEPGPPRESEHRLRRKERSLPKDLVEDGGQEDGGMAGAWRKSRRDDGLLELAEVLVDSRSWVENASNIVQYLEVEFAR